MVVYEVIKLRMENQFQHMVRTQSYAIYVSVVNVPAFMHTAFVHRTQVALSPNRYV